MSGRNMLEVPGLHNLMSADFANVLPHETLIQPHTPYMIERGHGPRLYVVLHSLSRVDTSSRMHNKDQRLYVLTRLIHPLHGGDTYITLITTDNLHFFELNGRMVTVSPATEADVRGLVPSYTR